MKIRSNFKDYYDNMMIYGIDNSIPFNRFTRFEKINNYLLPSFYTDIDTYSDPADIVTSWKSFTLHSQTCFRQSVLKLGEALYPIFIISRPRINGFGHEKYKVCYNIEDVDNIVQEVCNKSEYNDYMDIGKFRPWRYKHYTRKMFKDFFDEFAKIKAPRELANEPLLLLSATYIDKRDHKFEGVIEYNPCLKDIEFQRIMDGYKVYQELYMFLSNMFKEPPPIPYISDEIMLEAKGFDKKYSFRKSKQ